MNEVAEPSRESWGGTLIPQSIPLGGFDWKGLVVRARVFLPVVKSDHWSNEGPLLAFRYSGTPSEAARWRTAESTGLGPATSGFPLVIALRTLHTISRR